MWAAEAVGSVQWLGLIQRTNEDSVFVSGSKRPARTWVPPMSKTSQDPETDCACIVVSSFYFALAATGSPARITRETRSSHNRFRERLDVDARDQRIQVECALDVLDDRIKRSRQYSAFVPFEPINPGLDIAGRRRGLERHDAVQRHLRNSLDDDSVRPQHVHEALTHLSVAQRDQQGNDC